MVALLPAGCQQGELVRGLLPNSPVLLLLVLLLLLLARPIGIGKVLIFVTGTKRDMNTYVLVKRKGTTRMHNLRLCGYGWRRSPHSRIADRRQQVRG